MKFLELPDLEAINSSLNFDADDCRVRGKCEIYTTKSTVADKKLYKTLETRYQEDMMALSTSKSPEFVNSWTQPSPFGNLDQSSTRRTFMFILATLNASHPDHDFSSLQPNDFYKERFLSHVIESINTTLSNLGRRFSANGMWEVIDRHIVLSDCDIYSYTPDSDSDPYGDGALIWSQSYFFFNRNMKRILYISLHGFRMPIDGHGPGDEEAFSTPGLVESDSEDGYNDEWIANMDD
ncbi:repressor-RNA polymerase III Maf1 [Schizosaccharomyces japonicus yFS275]|uniref:Repressor of RNA polymerase III transcription MAF1 n=1 Tax=Schizosaccharomyces japonicus (strain yFS275 / FY16936) TaxID=402676 RepID=B6K1G9_SCHJY|nr:repressor-RNA polymerase III Maf1 [Schizosaccharomyces japonicus yFS275]EEB07790.2 repressor-RNA polymerase III Maf1 [Schizosaccharomyces japonicus yFS275]